MQRLHAADLSGYLLERGGWEHLCLPALSPVPVIHDFGQVCILRDDGEPLHPAREDKALIERARRELGSRAFAAQYQQEPLPEEGGMIRAAWLGRYGALPEAPGRIVQSWDTAIKAGAEHDASACLTFAEHEGISYLIEARTLRAEYPELKREVLAQAGRFSPHAVLIEDKASGQQLLQDLKRETHLPVIATRPVSDKVTRFAAVSAMIEAGRVKLPGHAPWLHAFEAEVLAFPGGRHDDQVDALTHYLDWLRGQESRRPGVRGFTGR
jgi:predicted phage terminase large subunit-like protein